MRQQYLNKNKTDKCVQAEAAVDALVARSESITCRPAAAEDIEAVLAIRFEMLAEINGGQLNHDLINNTRDYFETGNQSTFLAWEGEALIGCATICYFMVLPTYSHPIGLRAHIMNVYTVESYRRRGIGLKLVNVMLEEAKAKGVTHISLDATEAGRRLYQKCGFTEVKEGMEYNIQK